MRWSILTEEDKIRMDQGKVIKFLIYWIVNSAILIFTSAIFVNNVVLGNDKLPGSLAGVLSGLILTGLYYFIPVGVRKIDYKVKDENHLTIILFVASVVVIWIIKRLAIITGLGISNNLFVLLVAVFVTFGIWGTNKVIRRVSGKLPISI